MRGCIGWIGGGGGSAHVCRRRRTSNNNDERTSSPNHLMRGSIPTMESNDVFGSHTSASATELEVMTNSLRFDDEDDTAGGSGVNFVSLIATVKSRRPHTTGGRTSTRPVGQ